MKSLSLLFTANTAISILLLLLVAPPARFGVLALNVSDLNKKKTSPSVVSHSSVSSRRNFFQKSMVAAVGVPAAGAFLVAPGINAASAAETTATTTNTKLNLTDEQLKEIVKSDLLDKQFLVTGDLTPYIYTQTAKFTDEIDTYEMEQWQKGTQKLFVGDKSQVRLVGDVDVTRDKVEFRFDEDLMFRIPFRPTVHLTGRLELTRDPESGYINNYREYWDQDVATVLKSAKF